MDDSDECDDFSVGCHDFGLLRIWRLQNFWIADIVIIYLSTDKMDDDSDSGSPSYLSPFFPHRQTSGRPFLRAAGTVSGESGCFAQPLPPTPITPTPNVHYSDSVSLRIWIFLAVKGKIGKFEL